MISVTIPNEGRIISRLNFTGLGSTAVTHVRVQTFLVALNTSALTVSLVSPSGTTAILCSEGDLGSPDVFNGTIWDENCPENLANLTSDPIGLLPALQPDETFANFTGEDPNGSWQLVVVDDSATPNSAQLSRWFLDLNRNQISIPFDFSLASNFVHLKP